MNQAVLKFLALGVIGLVVASALWLASSVPAKRANSPYRTVQSHPFVPASDVHLAVLPPARAASAVMLRAVGVR